MIKKKKLDSKETALRKVMKYFHIFSRKTSMDSHFEKGKGKVETFFSPLFRMAVRKDDEEKTKEIIGTITTRKQQINGKIITFGKIRVRIVEFLGHVGSRSSKGNFKSKYVYKIEAI